MRKRSIGSSKPRQSVDDLFSEFVHEMNRFSTNGVIREMDHDRVVELAGHFLSQCSSRPDRSLLEEQILLLLNAKYQYQLLEGELHVSANLEESIREAIERVCRRYFKDATKFAGLAINWSLVKPYKLFRSFLEPAIANTVLTYSIAVHAPHLDRVDLESRLVAVVGERAVAVDAGREDRAGLYAELENVRQYSDSDLNDLVTSVNGPTTRRMTGSSTHVSESQKLFLESDLARKSTAVVLDPNQRKDVREDIRPTDAIRIEKNLVSEIRPIGTVQDVISQHELKIFNSYKMTQNKLREKHGRVSVRFAITAQGMTKDVSILHNSFNEDLAVRISNQIRHFRFSSIDAKLGDQTVYHTFYF